MSTFTRQQINQLEVLKQQAEKGDMAWGDVYEAVADMIEPYKESSLGIESVWSWFAGAAKVNRGEGAFSGLIWTYSIFLH